MSYYCLASNDTAKKIYTWTCAVVFGETFVFFSLLEPKKWFLNSLVEFDFPSVPELWRRYPSFHLYDGQGWGTSNRSVTCTKTK